MFRKSAMRRFALALPLLALLPATAPAQTVGDTLRDAGVAAAIVRLEAAPEGRGFERGALMVLRAVERAAQTAFRHGLGNPVGGLPLNGFMPRRGPTRATEPARPDTLASLTATLLADLEAARAVLATGDKPFDLDLTALWLDVDGDGRRGAREGAAETLTPMLMGRRAARNAPASLVVRFDAADRDWLVAYTHMVAGAGNLMLAFDPTPVLRDLASQSALLDSLPVVPEYYDLDALRARLPVLEAQVKEFGDRLQSLSTTLKPLQDRRRNLTAQLRAKPSPANKPALDDERAALDAEIAELTSEEQRLRRARRATTDEAQATRRLLQMPQDRDRAPGDTIAGLIREPVTALYVALTALRQQPDVARVHAARDHWLAMITANRRFWAGVEAETDNDREWIPNDRQQSALPVTLEPGTGATWLRVLDEAEAVLQGRLLLPHPLLPEGVGIDLSSWLETPGPIDLAAWVQGVGAMPHAARGPRISAVSWRRFTALSQGRAGALALWFN
jgi:hypothetical protein